MLQLQLQLKAVAVLALAVLAVAVAGAGAELQRCGGLSSCVQCTEQSPLCAWSPASASCVSRDVRKDQDQDEDEDSAALVFDDTCPVEYGAPDAFLANWMRESMDVLGDAALLDLSLPGTHDTLTYDLSTTVSEGGIDELYKLAELLHNKTEIVPDFIEDFIRSGAQTQDLTVTQQLDAGIRFLDVRMMLEYTDEPAIWYSLHMMQSRGTSLQYFREIRAWMDAHPSEVVVMWLSKHGNECATGQDQYPNVSIDRKRLFWKEILTVFDGLTVDFSQSSLNATSLSTLIARDHRAVFYVADYAEMTGYDAGATSSGESYFALDSCLIDNQLGNPAGPAAVEHQRTLYAAANDRKLSDKASQRLYLVSLVGGMDYVYATLLKFGKFDLIPKDDAQLVAECAATFNTPDMNWCPETLLDGSQLANYYTQVAMDEVIQKMLVGDESLGLPHAIYINAIGSMDGTIRTGTEVLWGKNRSPDEAHAQQGFSYVDSFVLYNILNVCNSVTSVTSSDTACKDLTMLLVNRRAEHPLTFWDDATYGRLITW